MPTKITLNPVDQVIGILEEGGSESYGGEQVSQLEHALQAAMLAEDMGKDEEFIVACLLHDVGHPTTGAQEVFDDTDASEDQLQKEGAGHGHAGSAFLQEVASGRMRWLIENHATAKRYLCAVDPGTMTDCHRFRSRRWSIREVQCLRRRSSRSRITRGSTTSSSCVVLMTRRRSQDNPHPTWSTIATCSRGSYNLVRELVALGDY